MNNLNMHDLLYWLTLAFFLHFTDKFNLFDVQSNDLILPVSEHWLVVEHLFHRLQGPSSNHGMPRQQSDFHLSQQVLAAPSDK